MCTLECISETASMPTCEYTIRRGSPDGPQIRFAKVGDKVYHRWECTSDMPQMFGILINNCYVDDGAGQRVQVLDDKGFDCGFESLFLKSSNVDAQLISSYCQILPTNHKTVSWLMSKHMCSSSLIELYWTFNAQFQSASGVMAVVKVLR